MFPDSGDNTFISRSLRDLVAFFTAGCCCRRQCGTIAPLGCVRAYMGNIIPAISQDHVSSHWQHAVHTRACGRLALIVILTYVNVVGFAGARSSRTFHLDKIHRHVGIRGARFAIGKGHWSNFSARAPAG